MRLALILAAFLAASAGLTAACTGTGGGGRDGDDDTGADTDTDADTDGDTDGDGDGDTDYPPAGNMCPGEVQSFIWIANTAESTVSKVCTITAEEVARYKTCPGSSCDPSRTSVNLHGDMVVTNRDPSGVPSSVTKIIADYYECEDLNDSGEIETSMGPDDVLTWGTDECVAWNTDLAAGAIGARATAWDGEEDPDTGEGGHVFIGALNNHTIYKLNGDTGAIMESAVTAIGHYGGAIDGQGNFWTVAMGCTIGLCQIERISLDDLNDHETHNVHCGYGISVDSQGRIWNAGMNTMGGGGCVSRYDNDISDNQWVNSAALDFNRGVAVGTELSAGYVWAAVTDGDLLKVDEDTLELVQRIPLGASDVVGVAVDFEGYVWAVSQGNNSAYKVHPESYDITTVPIGSGPYTYSDMTGMQLKGVIDIE